MFDPPYPSGLPIGDGWIEAPTSFMVRFPYDGSPVAAAPTGDVDLAYRALDASAAVAEQVAALRSHARRSALRHASEDVAAHREEFEQLLVLETGKPLVDCRVEVARTIVTLEASAEEVAQLHGETVPLDLLPAGEGLIGYWTRRPIGPVVGITGFNYPLLLAAHKIAPAIAAGCPVIAKPAPQTPLATLWLANLLRSSDALPPAAVQVVTGGAEVGEALVTDSRIGAVSFTGSAAVGHEIARAAAPKKVLLELGANCASSPPTPTWRRPPTRWSGAGTTRLGRPASRCSGCWWRRQSGTSSSTCWCHGWRRSSSAIRAPPTPGWRR
jgi:acyl-CoA reductase-like NAD-dependent aldehyde dehydrogenase